MHFALILCCAVGQFGSEGIVSPYENYRNFEQATRTVSRPASSTMPVDGGCFMPPGVAPLLQKLEQQQDFDFRDATLAELRDFLSRQDIRTHLDERALDDVGIATDTPFTFRHNNLSFKHALYEILKPMDLTWTIQHASIVITTPEACESNLLVFTYDVTDLVRVNNGAAADFDSLTELLTWNVQPQSWDDVGGPASVTTFIGSKRDLLVVTQTVEVHEQIAALLGQLRQANDSLDNVLGPQRNRLSGSSSRLRSSRLPSTSSR